MKINDDLLNRMAGNDNHLFEKIYDKYSFYLFNYLISLNYSEKNAELILHKLFHELRSNPSILTGEKYLSTAILKIFLSIARNFYSTVDCQQLQRLCPNREKNPLTIG